MDKISDSVKSVQSDSAGFFNYVFNFDAENKARIMNMLQYTLLSIIPILLVLRGIKHIIPEDDDSKGSFEILAESVGQVILIMLSIWLTNKIINFIPTYSGEEYPKFNEITFIVPFILLLATMQTKLGAKFNILIDRVTSMIGGKRNEAPPQNQQQQGQNVVRISQPLAGQHQPSQADYLDRSQLLPANPQLSSLPPSYAQPQQQQQQQQPSQDFNAMYQQNEPMAANESGSGWGSW
jgi:hypothetical protein